MAEALSLSSSRLAMNDIEDNPNQERPALKLYSPCQILFITFLGTVLAGMLAIAINYRKVGLVNRYKQLLIFLVVLIPTYLYVFIHLPSTTYDRLFPIGTAILLGIAASLWYIIKVTEELNFNQ